MIRRILAPLDGTRLSGSILPYTRLLAQKCDARVSLVSAVPPRNEHRRHALMVYLRRAAKWVKAGKKRKVDLELLTGSPGPAIAAYGAENGIDLITLCSEGKTGIKRLVEGSVTETLMRTSTIPILAVPPLQEGQKLRPFERILVPLDGSHRSTAIVSHAAELARDLDARLVLLRVVSSNPRKGDVPPKLALQNLTEQHLALLKLNLKVDLHMLHGEPAEAILSFAKANGADLLALATHGRTGLDRVLRGSVAEEILRRGKQPLLVVRSAAIPREHAVSGRAGRSRREALEFVKAAGETSFGPF